MVVEDREAGDVDRHQAGQELDAVLDPSLAAVVALASVVV
jgi:hypothetical protein